MPCHFVIPVPVAKSLIPSTQHRWTSHVPAVDSSSIARLRIVRHLFAQSCIAKCSDSASASLDIDTQVLVFLLGLNPISSTLLFEQSAITLIVRLTCLQPCICGERKSKSCGKEGFARSATLQSALKLFAYGMDRQWHCEWD